MSDSEITFTFDGVAYRMDANSLLMGEMVALEKQDVDLGKPMSMTLGLAWIAVRRERPDVPFSAIEKTEMVKLLSDNDPAETDGDENPISPASGNEPAGG